MRPFHLSNASGRRFCVLHEPSGIRSQPFFGAVVLAPPLAEELNRSRRQLSLMSCAFAQGGVQVLNLDLKGTGDSAGDFSDATWGDWIDDLEYGWRWLRDQTGMTPAIWGVRGGCWLGMALARRLQMPIRMLLWQPQKLGSIYLNQWLRQKTAGDMLQGQPKASTDQFRSQWAAGHVVEIGGYGVNADLALALQQADLGVGAQGAEILAFESVSDAGAGMAPASAALIQEWRNGGARTADWKLARGEAYWQLQEPPDQTELVSATLAGFLRTHG